MTPKRNKIPLDETALLAEPCKVELSDGRVLPIPRWSARKALKIGARVAGAIAGARDTRDDRGADSKTDFASTIAAIMPLAGEIVCETLDAPPEFLDAITKDDLAAILLAIVGQEFANDSWRDLQKKALALLARDGSQEQ